jgi:hypothetical protein
MRQVSFKGREDETLDNKVPAVKVEEEVKHKKDRGHIYLREQIRERVALTLARCSHAVAPRYSEAERSSGGAVTRLGRNPAMQQRPIAAGLVVGREGTSHTKSHSILAVFGRWQDASLARMRLNTHSHVASR